MAASPQQAITQSLRLNQAQILSLNSSPFVIVPAEPGYINILNRATLSYVYNTSPFTNVDNLLSFELLPEVGDPVLVSNSLSALNVLGISQSTSVSFAPANPYTPLMSDSANAPIVLTISGSDPIGGNVKSSLVVSFTYSIFQL